MKKFTYMLVFCFLVGSAGCRPLSYVAYALFGGGKTKIKAEYNGLRNHRTIIILSTGPGIDFEYPYARTNVALASAEVIKKYVKGVEFVKQDEVEAFQLENLDWATLPVETIAEKFQATRILYLDLYQFTMHEENSVHLIRGHIRAAVRAYEVNKTARAVYTTDVGMLWPEHSPVPMSDAAMQRLKMETYVKFAEKLALKFYDHKVPIK